MIADWPDPSRLAALRRRGRRALDRAPHRGRRRHPRGARSLQARRPGRGSRSSSRPPGDAENQWVQSEFGDMASLAGVGGFRGGHRRREAAALGDGHRVGHGGLRPLEGLVDFDAEARGSTKEREKAATELDASREEALQRGLPRQGRSRDRREGPREGRRARRLARARRGAARRARLGGRRHVSADMHIALRRGACRARAGARLRHQSVARRHHARCTRRSGDRRTRFASIQVTGTNGKTSTARLTAALLRGEGVSHRALHEPASRALPRADRGRRAARQRRGLRARGRCRARGRRATAPRRSGHGGAASPSSSCSPPPRCGCSASAASRSRCSRSGMGGRWDATSVVDPAVAVITGVGLDHTAILGDTLEQIAAEKAAIIKPASAPVLGPGTAGSSRSSSRGPSSSHAHARAVRAEGVATRRSPRSSPCASLSRRARRAPDGSRRCASTGVHAELPGARACRARVPGGQRRDRGCSGRGGARPGARRRARCATRLRSRALPGRFELVRDEPPVDRRRLAQPAGGGSARRRDRARRGPTRAPSGSCCSACSPTRTPRASSRRSRPSRRLRRDARRSRRARCRPTSSRRSVASVTGRPPAACSRRSREALAALRAVRARRRSSSPAAHHGRRGAPTPSRRIGNDGRLAAGIRARFC